jgi:hypothetical protein
MAVRKCASLAGLVFVALLVAGSSGCSGGLSNDVTDAARHPCVAFRGRSSPVTKLLFMLGPVVGLLGCGHFWR